MKINKKNNKRKWLKYVGLYLCALLILCITGCSKEEPTDEAVKTIIPKTTMESVQKEDSDIEEEENILGEDEGDSVPINKVDWNGYQEKLSADDYQILQKYMPVLTENTEFIWIQQMSDGGFEKRKVTLQNFLFIQGEGETEQIRKQKMILNSIALCDVFQTGHKDLILHIENYGWEYIILHYEKKKLYGIVMPERWFGGVQGNGMYYGSSGAFSGRFCRMIFSEDGYSEKVLAGKDEKRCYIGQKKVSRKKYETWVEKNASDEVKYYIPVKK